MNDPTTLCVVKHVYQYDNQYTFYIFNVLTIMPLLTYPYGNLLFILNQKQTFVKFHLYQVLY